uniref:Integrase, catalytic region, zinc finger, CCHC-type, peptidase aspartic, catalytic n=1 Tax=Tanacetum cinerariifolium TaxID=118510 RepID=A0A699IYR7_TANCI|nr:integrase, catalytic region, zinc finger, CCHC-type, peptidase aspartic, catalytic [Tanacetum cinerariifolium]
MGTVRFGNDNFAAITGYGDYIQGNITICHVYYVEGLGHNLFSVGQFCDGDLEVAFRSKTFYVRNLEGDDLLTGGRKSNLYTISISDMAASLPICLMSKATSTKSWLWHRRLSHLNFGTINDLTRLDLVDGLLKFKYGKDYLCSTCKRVKSKKASHPPKLVLSDNSKLELLHMDLCGPMRRHQFLRFEGLQYTDTNIADFEERLGMIYGREADSARQIFDKGDLSAYWIGISPAKDFLGTTPSYTSTKDPMLRLCHMLIACNIAGRSQAHEKGLMVIVQDLSVIDMGEMVWLQIYEELDDTWDRVAPN